MKHPFKIITIVALAFLVVNGASAAEVTNGLREEASTLENIYQEKAHATLDTLMNPEDYTLVISATLKNDEAKLKEYHSMVEKKFLPGMVMNDPSGFGEEHNILHALKQKVEIQVILNDRVPADRDVLVKDILKSKLKLNEEGGDTIGVVRAFHNAPFLDKSLIKKIPELSGKMIAFLLVLAALTIAGIVMWLYKRHEDKIAEAEARGAQIVERERLKEAIKEENGETAEAAVVSDNSAEEMEAKKRRLEQNILLEREQIISLTKQYSGIVHKAFEDFVTDGKINQATLFMESIGWDESRQLFKNIDNKIWSRIATNLRLRESDPKLEEIYNAIHEFQRFALSHVLEKAGNSFENPFNFIFQLSHSNRLDLLQNETSYNIALISIYSTGSQMSELMSGLSSTVQNEVFFNITKIRHLPESEVNQGVANLLAKLDGIKKAPSIHVNGFDIASKFIRSLDPVKEEEMYKSMQNQHPKVAKLLRRTQVIFEDIATYPPDLVGKVIEGLESDDILKALCGMDSELVDSFLGLLPTKKALIIQNDLFHLVDVPPVYQCAAARRKIVEKVEQEFERIKFSVAEFWNNLIGDNGAGIAEVTTVNEVPNLTELRSEIKNENIESVETSEEDSEKKAA
jgi:flagellar basal body-associated protein FliL